MSLPSSPNRPLFIPSVPNHGHGGGGHDFYGEDLPGEGQQPQAMAHAIQDFRWPRRLCGQSWEMSDAKGTGCAAGTTQWRSNGMGLVAVTMDLVAARSPMAELVLEALHQSPPHSSVHLHQSPPHSSVHLREQEIHQPVRHLLQLVLPASRHKSTSTPNPTSPELPLAQIEYCLAQPHLPFPSHKRQTRAPSSKPKQQRKAN
ncbi:hypothetical protein SEVIR_4G173326v4 [Setaria viridis]